MISSIRSFTALPLEERINLFQALLCLPIFHCCTRFLPLFILIKLFNLKQANQSLAFQSNPQALPIVDKIKWTIGTIDRRLPFWPGLCFAQALTARMLLHKYNIPCTLYLGARKHERLSMQAHAWLCVGNYVITGFNTKNVFIPLIAFL